MSLNQAKDFIGGAGVIIFPEDILELKQDSTSDEIFTAFGGKTNFNNTISKIKTESLIKIGDGPLYSISLVVGASYTDEDNSQVVIQSLSLNVSFYLQVTVTNGTAKALVAKYTFVDAANVLQKNNTTAYTPTQHYHPATKAYADNIGYGKTITTTVDKFLNTTNLSGVDAEQRVIDLFGSLDIFKNVVANILANHVRYYFHFGDNPDNNCVELGCVNAWRASNNSSHELHFIITYYDENNLYTNRISIVVNNDTAASKVIIASLVNSDNVATLTKKTSTEYSNINPKANNTAYLVTDD